MNSFMRGTSPSRYGSPDLSSGRLTDYDNDGRVEALMMMMVMMMVVVMLMMKMMVVVMLMMKMMVVEMMMMMTMKLITLELLFHDRK